MFVRVGLSLTAYFGGLKAFLLSPIMPYAAHLIGTGAGFWYLVGPLVFLTVRLLVDPRASLQRMHGLHLFPLLWMLPGLLPFFVLPAETKVAMFEASLMGSTRPSLQSLMHVAIILAYVGASVRVVKDRWTAPGPATRNVILGCLVLIAGVLAVETGVAFFGVSRFLLGHSTTILVLVFFLVAAYSAIRVRRQGGWISEDVSPYARASADQEVLVALGQRAVRFMESERLFLNPELQRSDVAELLGISDHRLSQVVSQALDTNFHAFVNAYRVREAQRLLGDPAAKAFTLLSIGHDAGFNSKSSFNRVFKEVVGETPSAYRERLN